MKPTENRVLIRPDSFDNVTEGGVHMPDSANRVSNLGEVIATGPGRLMPDGNRIPVELEVGDRVFFLSSNIPSFELNGERIIMLADSQVAGVLEEGDDLKTEVPDSSPPPARRPKHIIPSSN